MVVASSVNRGFGRMADISGSTPLLLAALFSAALLPAVLISGLPLLGIPTIGVYGGGNPGHPGPGAFMVSAALLVLLASFVVWRLMRVKTYVVRLEDTRSLRHVIWDVQEQLSDSDWVRWSLDLSGISGDRSRYHLEVNVRSHGAIGDAEFAGLVARGGFQETWSTHNRKGSESRAEAPGLSG